MQVASADLRRMSVAGPTAALVDEGFQHLGRIRLRLSAEEADPSLSGAMFLPMGVSSAGGDAPSVLLVATPGTGPAVRGGAGRGPPGGRRPAAGRSAHSACAESTHQGAVRPKQGPRCRVGSAFGSWRRRRDGLRRHRSGRGWDGWHRPARRCREVAGSRRRSARWTIRGLWLCARSRQSRAPGLHQ